MKLNFKTFVGSDTHVINSSRPIHVHLLIYIMHVFVCLAYMITYVSACVHAHTCTCCCMCICVYAYACVFYAGLCISVFYRLLLETRMEAGMKKYHNSLANIFK